MACLPGDPREEVFEKVLATFSACLCFGIQIGCGGDSAWVTESSSTQQCLTELLFDLDYIL